MRGPLALGACCSRTRVARMRVLRLCMLRMRVLSAMRAAFRLLFQRFILGRAVCTSWTLVALAGCMNLQLYSSILESRV